VQTLGPIKLRRFVPCEPCAVAADLFTEVSRGIDKWLWFVEAHLQAER
jgi:hypothetical protein